MSYLSTKVMLSYGIILMKCHIICDKTVLVRIHNICFNQKDGKSTLNYLIYIFLDGALW